MKIDEKKEMLVINIETEEGIIEVKEEKGISLYELSEKYYKDSNGLKALIAIVNDEVKDLLYLINDTCSVKFLTLKERLARLAYQRTVFFIYLMAVKRLFPEAYSSLRYPLNGGLYTQLHNIGNQSTGIVYRIEREMKKIILDDLELRRIILSREQILSDKVSSSISQEVRNFVTNSEIKEIFEYHCEEYSQIFYNYLLPRTGLITIFEVVPYKEGLIIRMPQFEDPVNLPKYRDDIKLFDAFREISIWRSCIGVKYIYDLNKKITEGAYYDMMLVTEAFQEKHIAYIADEIIKKGKRIILIAGPSSSGKTTFAQRLCIQLRVNGKRPLYMGTDDYFLERKDAPRDKNGKFDFESLSAMDLNLFNNQMNDLLMGKMVDMPVFDFITGSKRYGSRIERAEKDQPIVIEGIHALNDELTKYINNDYKYHIYISPLTALNVDRNNRIPVTDIRLLRRIARDIRSRGKTAAKTLEEWMSVREGEVKNIFPFINRADALFNSAFIYELAVLKPLVEPSLKAIARENSQYVEAQRLLHILSFVKPITDISNISNNSIIREFIGGGIWVK